MTTVTESTTNIETKVGCIAATSEILGNKWTALILRDLSSGPKRFCQIERTTGGINPRTLSQRLRDLENRDIISKKLTQDSPCKYCYELTQKGQDLVPVLHAMASWGAKYSSKS